RLSSSRSSCGESMCARSVTQPSFFGIPGRPACAIGGLAMPPSASGSRRIRPRSTASLLARAEVDLGRRALLDRDLELRHGLEAEHPRDHVAREAQDARVVLL